jgi:pyridinium-3,5-bisthiocarboxylic acid mononucleotide nickel chelatase
MLAYFDCFSGISGDMTVAALIDAGLDPTFLKDQLSLLDVQGWSFQVRRSSRHGISGLRFEVDEGHGHHSRNYKQVRGLIENAGIADVARDKALRIFEVLARAEAHVHGVEKDDVHFHEIGAVDSIVDVVGAAVGVTALGIDRIICAPLPFSRGFVSTAHGILPTPAPATVEILKGVPVRGVDSPIELVTPTGAGIVKALASEFGPFPPFVPSKIGYGLGRSDPVEFPNALRVVLGEENPRNLGRDQVGVIQCQVDDLDPRVLGALMELLMGSGALDVTFGPVQMKKNRPGTSITAIVRPEDIPKISQLLLEHTTTIGVRVSYSDRIVIERSAEVASTSLGPVRVKVISRTDGVTERRVEFDDVRDIAERLQKPVRDVLRQLEREVDGSGEGAV